MDYNILKEEIRNRVKMEDVLCMYGIHPTRGTNIYHCIYHDDRHPSAHITPHQRFRCFSGACGVKKDIFDIVQDQEQCGFVDAMKIIDEKFGLCLIGKLTYEQKLQLAKLERERKKKEEEKLWWEQFEREVRGRIAKELKKWENTQRDTHITRGEYRRGEWQFADLFFESLKRQDWLNWLYDAVCGFDHPECEYDYIYPADKKEILKMIREGEIEV